MVMNAEETRLFNFIRDENGTWTNALRGDDGVIFQDACTGYQGTNMLWKVDLNDTTLDVMDFEVEVCMWQSVDTTNKAEEKTYLLTNRLDLEVEWPMSKFDELRPPIST